MGEKLDRMGLEAYFRRIGYEGPQEATLQTLCRLHFLHPLAIAFENLDPLLQRQVKLDLASLEQKLVQGNRGGYCFEQNLLFMAALMALGFRVSGLAARVLWGRGEDAVTPRSHMLLKVELPEGTYLADVGFGGLTLTAPLRLEAGWEQATPHEIFRLDREGDMWRMRAKLGEEWRSLYRFSLDEQFLVDYEITNYFISTSPESHFLHSLMAARPTSEGRHALLNDQLKTYDLNGSYDLRMLSSGEEVVAVLRTIFGIQPTDLSGLGDVLEKKVILKQA
ncbi:arylamine N-acetyltransferase [Chelativorans sp. J32]|uniref:arylamine N-acetyltransferase family protein n=1 Tax=Chelativorans sp. J32 TaxID=935840 RepID=UPI0004828E72|nr:arylamine N-acetyltransferase [Chelativorans sp. J32]